MAACRRVYDSRHLQVEHGLPLTFLTDRRTDGRANRRTQEDSIFRASLAARGNKTMSVDQVLDGTNAACLPGDWTLVCRIAIVLKMQTTQNQLIAYTRQRFTTHNIQRAVIRLKMRQQIALFCRGSHRSVVDRVLSTNRRSFLNVFRVSVYGTNCTIEYIMYNTVHSLVVTMHAIQRPVAN